MKSKLILLVTMAVSSFSAHAIKPSEYFIERPGKLNISVFSQTTTEQDMAYCQKIMEPICKGKNCTEENNIQNLINASCISTVNDKLALVEPPMGPVGFLPDSYSGMTVFISQFRGLLLLPPEINETQYKLYVSYFDDIKSKYYFFDNQNIRTTFRITGKYLEDKKNLKKPAYKEFHDWASDTMKERKFIEKQISSIKLALSSHEKLNEFQKDFEMAYGIYR